MTKLSHPYEQYRWIRDGTFDPLTLWCGSHCSRRWCVGRCFHSCRTAPIEGCPGSWSTPECLWWWGRRQWKKTCSGPSPVQHAPSWRPDCLPAWSPRAPDTPCNPKKVHSIKNTPGKEIILFDQYWHQTLFVSTHPAVLSDPLLSSLHHLPTLKP